MASLYESDKNFIEESKRPRTFRDYRHLEGGPQPPKNNDEELNFANRHRVKIMGATLLAIAGLTVPKIVENIRQHPVTQTQTVEVPNGIAGVSDIVEFPGDATSGDNK